MTGQIDISFSAVGFEETHGITLVDLPLEDFIFPITAWSKTVCLTGRASARRMTKAGSGVTFVLNAPAGNEAMGGGFPTACAAIQTIARTLAGEFGPPGVRVLCCSRTRFLNLSRCDDPSRSTLERAESMLTPH